MISRHYIKCKVCEEKITLRVVIGGNPEPVYTFRCPKCNVPITIGLIIDNQKVEFEYKYINNCSPSDSEGQIINLSAEIAFGEQHKNNEFYFPTIHFDRSLFGNKKQKYNVQLRIHENWENLEKTWSLTLNGKYEIAEKYLDKYKYFTQEDIINDVYSQIWDYSYFFVIPEIYKDYELILGNIQLCNNNNGAGFKSFIQYFYENHFQFLFVKSKEVFNLLMENFDTFYPTLLFIKMKKEVPNNFHVHSFDFEKQKMIYGKLFEIITDFFVIPACINNLSNNRRYDQFNTMDLKKYLELDKASRGNPFKDNQIFCFLLKEHNTKIRNASHHSNIWYDVSNNLIKYQSGKPLKEYQMTPLTYTVSCNKLFVNIIVLIMINLFLFENYRAIFKKEEILSKLKNK